MDYPFIVGKSNQILDCLHLSWCSVLPEADIPAKAQPLSFAGGTWLQVDTSHGRDCIATAAHAAWMQFNGHLWFWAGLPNQAVWSWRQVKIGHLKTMLEHLAMVIISGKLLQYRIILNQKPQPFKALNDQVVRSLGNVRPRNRRRVLCFYVFMI